MTDESDRSTGASFSRRQYLAGIGAGASLGLAGCIQLGTGSTTYDRKQANFDPPTLAPSETYPPREDVTMFRRGTRRLGYYPDKTVPDEVEINWQFPVNYIGWTAAKASPRPSPDGETILIPGDTGKVHAVTPDGKLQWTRWTGANSLGIHGTPCIVGDTAYVSAYDGDLYAFDVESGDLVWRTTRTELNNSIAIGSSPAYWDGIIYVVVEYKDPDTGTMWALDAETGEPLWSDDRPHGMPHPSPSINPESERLVIGSNDGIVYSWEFPSMDFAWSFETGAEVKGTIPTYDGSAFVGSWDNNFYRLSLEDGSEEWSFETGNIIMSNAGVDPDAGVVYFGSDDNHVYALDVETGDLLWSKNVNGSVIGGLTITAESVMVGSYDGHLYALHKDTGETRWRVENHGHVTATPVPFEDRILYAERAVLSGYWDDDNEYTVERPGHAYCLVEA